MLNIFITLLGIAFSTKENRVEKWRRFLKISFEFPARVSLTTEIFRHMTWYISLSWLDWFQLCFLSPKEPWLMQTSISLTSIGSMYDRYKLLPSQNLLLWNCPHCLKTWWKDRGHILDWSKHLTQELPIHKLCWDYAETIIWTQWLKKLVIRSS